MNKEQIFMMYFAAGWKEMLDTATGQKWKIQYAEEVESAAYDDVFGTKLILREYKDMKKTEYKTWNNFEDDEPRRVVYLLSIGIDLFNAIEQGFAINAKDLE